MPDGRWAVVSRGRSSLALDESLDVSAPTMAPSESDSGPSIPPTHEAVGGIKRVGRDGTDNVQGIWTIATKLSGIVWAVFDFGADASSVSSCCTLRRASAGQKVRFDAVDRLRCYEINPATTSYFIQISRRFHPHRADGAGLGPSAPSVPSRIVRYLSALGGWFRRFQTCAVRSRHRRLLLRCRWRANCHVVTFSCLSVGSWCQTSGSLAEGGRIKNRSFIFMLFQVPLNGRGDVDISWRRMFDAAEIFW